MKVDVTIEEVLNLVRMTIDNGELVRAKRFLDDLTEHLQKYLPGKSNDESSK